MNVLEVVYGVAAVYSLQNVLHFYAATLFGNYVKSIYLIRYVRALVRGRALLTAQTPFLISPATQNDIF